MDIVGLLIDKGANIDVQDKVGIMTNYNAPTHNYVDAICRMAKQPFITLLTPERWISSDY